MDTILLGKTGLAISRVGFGGIPIQKIDAAGTREIFDALVDLGVNYIDTAKAYTVSESYIGEAIRGRREKFVLATKSMARTAVGMEADIADSMKKLGTEYIDLYQIHNPTLKALDEVKAPGGALEALKKAKAEGKIGHIGLTAHSLEVFEAGLEMPDVETIMFPYNIVENQGEELIRRCRGKNIGFIAMKPMAGGAIEDPTLAMRYILANPDVTVVIPGMASVGEVKVNIAAGEDKTPISEEERKKIAAIRETLGTNFCRRCNYCAPCTVGIQIPSVFLFGGYLDRYGLEKWARERYATLSVKAGACVGCGACEPRCPYHLPIRTMLKEYAGKFGE